MKKIIVKVITVLIMFLTAESVVAAELDRYVSKTGIDTNDGKSWDSPKLTIQAAIDSTQDGATIYVSNGVYVLSATLKVPSWRNFWLYSKDRDPSTVTIDCNGFSVAAADTMRMEGFTVVNGRGHDFSSTERRGGGIYALAGRVTNCRVKDCHLSSTVEEGKVLRGGGVCLMAGQVQNCVISGCTITNAWTGSGSKASTGGGIYVGGQSMTASVQNCVVSNCHVYVTETGYTGVHPMNCAGGGIHTSENGALISNCRVYDCSAVSGNATTTIGFGGGIFANNSVTITNSIVAGCRSSTAGAGIAFSSGDNLVRHCTISNNVMKMVKAVDESNLAAGIRITDDTTVDGCVIVDNRTDDENGALGYASGGGGVGLMGTGGILKNCMIRNNRGYQGGAICFATAKDVVISNCLFEGNYSARRGGFGFTKRPDNVLIVDCVVKGSYAEKETDAQLMWMHAETSSNLGGLHFRNCYISGNGKGQGAGFSLYRGTTTGLVPLEFEQCSIVGNSISDSGAIYPQSDSAYRDTKVLGCVIAANGATGNVNLAPGFKTSENVTYTYATGGNLNMDATLHNIDSGNPMFVDAAKGDYRILPNSPLANAGGAVRDWMGARGKRSPVRDMGDGTFRVSSAADWGVVLTRNNTFSRLVGETPSMGCFEYEFHPGFILLLK